MRQRRRSVLTVLALSAGVAMFGPLSGGGSGRPSGLYEWEAQTLLFLAPGIQRNVREGAVVKFGREHSPKLNQNVLYCYRAMVETESPSNLIGNYAINRYTADVLDTDAGTLVEGADLAAVQAVLRRVHGIGEAEIRKYRVETDVNGARP